MNKKIVIAVACILTSMCLSCAVPGPQSSVNTLNGSASPEPIQVGISEGFASKVTHLQDIMKKFNTDLRPNEKADICADCISSLKDILLEKESVSASEEDIIGGDESFYLKFRYKAVIDGVTYRLAEFGVIRKEELVRERGEEKGTQKVLLLQSWEGNNDIVDVQHIYSAYISENITVLLDYELIKAGDTYYINIIDKEYTPETFVMHLTTYKYENQKWVPNIETDELTDDTWTLEVQASDNKEYLLISCANIDYRNGYGYDCRYRYRRLNITALDNSGAIIGTLELLFDSGKWVVESTGPAQQELPPDWHYYLKKDGLYRTALNTGDIIKINGQTTTGGLIITEDWVYYRADSRIWRMDNENKREQLTEEDWWNPSLSGGWLYCINASGIARMKPDGSEKEQIVECTCNTCQ